MKITNKIDEIVLAVTYRCNSRCRMCNIWQIKNHENEFSLEDIKKLPRNLKSINISGGEPFLRKDLVDMIKAIVDHLPKANIIISSNGFVSDLILEKTKEIMKIKPNIGIAISLDGIGEGHNDVRNIPGGFERILETIAYLKKAGMNNLRIGFTMGDYNTHELKRVYDVANRLDMEMSLAVTHSSDNFFKADNSLDNKAKMIDELDWLIKQELSSWKIKRWARAYFAHGMKHYLKTGQRLLPDYSGKANFFIDPQGNIFANDVSSELLGNINSTKLEDLMQKNHEIKDSWMICTARPAIKKHKTKVISWMLKNKINNFVK